MRTNLKVFIVDDNEEMVHGLKTGISRANNMEVVGYAYNGKDALEGITRLKPDFAIVDGIMPEMDGIDLVEAIKQEKLPTECILITAHPTDNNTSLGRSKGIDYFLAKPFTLEALINRIWSIHENPLKNMRNLTVEERVTEVLHEIGVPAHIRGYHYSRRAIVIAVDKPEIINYVTKELYPTISRDFETTASRVERAIRHAIEVAWTRGKVDVLERIFGYTINTQKGKPTNSEFIALIADMIRIEMRRSLQ